MIKASLSRRSPILSLIAYEEGLYQFNFVGDLTYTDSMSVVWTWVGVSTLAPTILGVRIGSVNLLPVNSIAECKSTPGSWYYPTPKIYIHWPASAGDWSIERAITGFQVGGNIDVADSYDPSTQNYDGGSFFDPALQSISNFGFKIDPVNLGLAQSQQIQITIDNSGGKYTQIDEKVTRGAILQITENGATLMTARTIGIETNEKTTTVSAEENRFFYDPIVRRNQINSTDYPNVSTDIAGTMKPVAFGLVRRHQVTPVNLAVITKASIGTVRFLVSDPSFGPLNSSGTLFDNNGFQVTITGSNLADCWVEYSKPANAEVDLKKFTWSGQVGSSSGLQIIENAYGLLSDYPYIPSLWDTAKWSTIKASLASKPVGVSLRENETLLSGIVQPICNSLQVAMFTTREGLLSASVRGSSSVYAFEAVEMEDISYSYDSRGFSPTITVEYSPGYEISPLSVVDNTYQTDILRDYGTVSPSSINPVKTVLQVESDASDLASLLMEINKDPVEIIKFTAPYNQATLSIIPFDTIIANDMSIEVHSLECNYYSQRITITGRIL